ncbi:MAG: calcium/sodium antiporter [Erysipelotrichaceae bacterium]|nr:calcium/sodium antiporter [Erysipelotrichaceae bacterium]MDY5252083.1 calcium/sodium antiporter [Erysipelotrichaceae bacterium]
MFLNIILLSIGFILLIKGADIFVDGASSIALFFKIPTIVIGLTIVAFGTSAPEAAVSIAAALDNSSAISISNVIGSNIFNVLAVLGINAMICSLPITNQVVKQDLPILVCSSLLTLIFMYDSRLNRWEGLILLLGIILYCANLIRFTLTHSVASKEETQIISLPKAIVLALVGLAGVIIGGDMVVDSAKMLALSFGMSEKLVGLTIVSIGTSLPELVTGIIAARKGETDIAIGNVVGSCIFNLLFILGISCTISPYGFESILMIDGIIMLATTILLYALAVIKHKINRYHGIFFVSLFIIYTAYIIMRN